MSTPPTVPALKEWAVVLRALLAGEQLLDLRKGGLREEGRHFAVPSSRCWLYPTFVHQDATLVKPAYRRWVESRDEPPESVRIEGWADIVGVARLTSSEDLARLTSKVVWTDDYAASRLRWKARDPLWVLALRVHRLAEPIVVASRDEHGGCTSWIDVDELPADPTTLDAEPVLSDESFTARLDLIARELPDGFEGPQLASR